MNQQNQAVQSDPGTNFYRQHIKPEFDRLNARLDRDLLISKPLDQAMDPLVPRAKLLRDFLGGLSPNSAAAEMIIARLPWIELSAKRFFCRASAVQALIEQLEAEAVEAQAAERADAA